jgi:hypothetical protein
MSPSSPVREKGTQRVLLLLWCFLGSLTLVKTLVLLAAILALVALLDLSSLIAKPQSLSCDTFSVYDSFLPGLQVSLESVQLPRSTFFHVVPTSCEVNLALRGAISEPHRAPVLLKRSNAAVACGTTDASTTIPAWWLPPILRAVMEDSRESLSLSADIADSVSLLCQYTVLFCVSDAVCFSVVDGDFVQKAAASALVSSPSATPSASTSLSRRLLLSTTQYLNESFSATPDDDGVSSQDAKTFVPLFTIPMSTSSPATVFSVTRNVVINVAGASFAVEGCQSCTEASFSVDPPSGSHTSAWSPLYSLEIGGIQARCSSLALAGSPCVVEVNMQATQHPVPTSWLTAFGTSLFPLAASALKIPAPLKAALASALLGEEAPASVPGGAAMLHGE